jgi:hypothetical protein
MYVCVCVRTYVRVCLCEGEMGTERESWVQQEKDWYRKKEKEKKKHYHFVCSNC